VKKKKEDEEEEEEESKERASEGQVKWLFVVVQGKGEEEGYLELAK